uniref:Uncharacterized protein n=1 Tax=Daphnia galeata TaxID=27404 RepID=A0A8J2RVQ5_9CRUS|nr:unnamed protein product [Daphnia galeata]
MLKSFAAITAGAAFMYGWSRILDLSCKNPKPESDSVVVPKTKKKNRLSDESKTELANLKGHYDDQISTLNQEKSVLKEEVTIAKAETEEKCKLLDESQTELANLKVHYDDKISVLNQENSALKEEVTIAKAETEEKCKLLDESQTELANLKVHYDDKISVLNQENSALKEEVTIAKAETGEKCKLLDESQTELANLKVHYDDQISVLNQEKSALKVEVTIAKAETGEKCKLLDASQTEFANQKVHYDEQISILDQRKKETDNIILELQRQLNSSKDDLKTLEQSAASARQQAEAFAIEQSAALTEALRTLQQAVRHAKEEPPSGPDAEEEPVGINETLDEWLIKHGFKTRVPPKTWIQLLEHSGFLMEEKVSHLREKAKSLFHDETDDLNNHN